MWPVDLGEFTVGVRDLGPEPAYHADRRLFGTWRRYEARLVGSPQTHETGWSVFDAVHRLVANYRAVFDERWPLSDHDDQEGLRDDGVG